MEILKMVRDPTIDLIHCLLVINLDEKYFLTEFLRDFEYEAGYCLSETLFGHETVEDFLKSIPDVVEVVYEDGIVSVKPPAGRKTNPSPEHSPGLEKVPGGAVDDLSGASTKCDTSRLKKRRRRKRYRARRRNRNEAENGVKPSQDTAVGGGEEEVMYGGDILCGRCASMQAEKAEQAHTLAFRCIDKCLSTVVLDERDVSYVNLRDDAKEGDRIEVSVPEVSHPQKFILHLLKYEEGLTQLMARMLAFYNSHKTKYGLGAYQFVENEMCAAYHATIPEFREWYRAKVVNFGREKTTVLLIDYGTTAEVGNRSLRFLDRMFGDLPVQAINGRLANVRPCNGNFWSEDECKGFNESVFEKDLAADVVTADSKERSLSVVLSSLDGRGVPINDAFINGESGGEKSASPNVYESNYPKEFVEAGDIGKTRRLRSQFVYDKVQRQGQIGAYVVHNRELWSLWRAAERGDA